MKAIMESKKSAIYANGVVSSLSKDLLSKEFLKKLAESKSTDDFCSLLQESSFFGAYNFEENSFEDIMKMALSNLANFVKTESPNLAFSKIFLLGYDYHNVYSFLTCELTNENFEDYVDVEGNYSLSQIKEYIVSQSLDNFKNEYLKNSIMFFEKLKAEEPIDMREIDTFFKQQMFKNMLDVAKRDKILYRLIKTKIDIENISCAMRAKTQFELEGLFVAGGVLSQDDIKNVFFKNKCDPKGDEQLYLKKFLKCAYDDKKVSAYLNFERMRNFVEIDLLKDYASEVESDIPFMLFCYKKLIEIKNLRLISSCIKNNLFDIIQKKLLWEG